MLADFELGGAFLDAQLQFGIELLQIGFRLPPLGFVDQAIQRVGNGLPDLDQQGFFFGIERVRFPGIDRQARR